MAVIDPRDELLLRAIGGIVVQSLKGVIDPSAVFSAKTKGRAGSWRLVSTSAGWSALRRRGQSLLRESRPEVVLRSDIRHYYGSCASNVVAEHLAELGLSEDAVEAVRTRMDSWDTDGVAGLPIGPEFSSVVGTGLLADLDRILRNHPAVPGHLRYTDDLFIPVGTAGCLPDVVESLRSGLGDLGLEINWAKTMPMPPDVAMEEFQRGLIEYIKDDLDVAAEEALESLLEVITAYQAGSEVDLRLVKFGLSVMARRRYFDAVPVVLEAEALLQYMPRTCADLLKAVAPIGDLLVEKVMLSLLEGSRDASAARDLHLIRAVENEDLGRAEGDVLLCTALDVNRPAVTRSWALVTAARTASVSDDDLADLAELDDDGLVRRAAILGFRMRPGRQRDKFLSDPRVCRGELRFAAAWAKAA